MIINTNISRLIFKSGHVKYQFCFKKTKVVKYQTLQPIFVLFEWNVNADETMPEGPELHIAARFINSVAKHYRFGGPIVKSEVSTKNPAVTWKAAEYTIEAQTRGKELKVFLRDAKKPASSTHLLFRFGMSGCFKLAEAGDLPKHAHLRFTTISSKPAMTLCFVDYRRFGRWELEGDWGKDRGPDPVYEYKEFRENVLANLDNAAFNRPLCEAMLNQKYFNGIGNYLRAEIIFRAGVKPFDKARDVLEGVKAGLPKVEGPDILELCNIIPKEVLSLDTGKIYDLDNSQKSQDTFSSWLQCYYVDGMKNLEDGNGRTMWFTGEPGSMAPKVKKVKGRKGKKGTQIPQSGKDDKAEVKEEIGEASDVKVEVKEEVAENTMPSKRKRAGKEEKVNVKAKSKTGPNKEEIKSASQDNRKAKSAKAACKRAGEAAEGRKNIKQPRKTGSRRASSDVDFKKYF